MVSNTGLTVVISQRSTYNYRYSQRVSMRGLIRQCSRTECRVLRYFCQSFRAMQDVEIHHQAGKELNEEEPEYVIHPKRCQKGKFDIRLHNGNRLRKRALKDTF